MRYLIALAVLALALTAVAQPWRYVDEKGEVHYTNDVMQLPPKQRARVLKQLGLEADAGKSLPVGTGRRPGREDDAGVPMAPPAPSQPERAPPAPSPPERAPSAPSQPERAPPAAPQPAGAPRPAPPPRTSGGDEGAVDHPAAAPAGASAADEKRWQILVREARERIADAEHERDNARAALDQAQRQAITIPSGQAYAAREAAGAKLAETEQKVAEARAAFEQLQEDARRQGIPPGWLR
jgi:hypothetical protein